jgi:hypothetical protein
MARKKKGKVFNILLLVGLGVGGYWLWKTGRLQGVSGWFSQLGTTQPTEDQAAQQAAQQAAAQQAAAQQAEALRQKAIIDAAVAAAAVLAGAGGTAVAGGTAAGGTAVAGGTAAAGGTATGLTPAKALWGAVGVSVPLWLGLSPQAPKLAGDIGHWLDKTLFGIEPWEPGQVITQPATTYESERAKWARMLPPGTSIAGLTNAQVKALALSMQ